jgi:hypothetical protein
MTALLPLVLACVAAAETEDLPVVLVVVGAPGTAEYGMQFDAWAERLVKTAETAQAKVVRLGPGATEAAPGDHDLARVQAALAALPAKSPHPVWVVLLGHGTYDRRKAMFNLEGPDLSADELNEWLKPLERPIAVINCASCSGPFINALSGPNRVIVTATRTGSEQNFARFGEFFSQSIADPGSDLDKDQQVSLLEAFLAASSRVEEFYKQERRLATEHALLDDTGDALGVQASWFRGVRATRAAKDNAEIDGLRANQMHLQPSPAEEQLSPEQAAQRDALEADLEELRRRKSELTESDYYAELEGVLIQLARIYAESDAKEPTAEKPATSVPPQDEPQNGESPPDASSPEQPSPETPSSDAK